MIRHPVCPLDDKDFEDLARFDHAGRTYAPDCETDGAIFGSKGQCTHWQVHPGTGSVTVTKLNIPCTKACSTTRPAPGGGPLARPLGTSTQHVLPKQ